jgi:hypothetical protein
MAELFLGDNRDAWVLIGLTSHAANVGAELRLSVLTKPRI